MTGAELDSRTPSRAVGETQRRPEWTFAAAGVLGSWFLRVMRATWRVRQHPPRFVLSRRAARTSGPGTIYVQWHSRIALSASTQAGTGTRVLVSQHGDGEYITRIIHRLGMSTIRGSTTRGGARALLEVVRALRDGHDVGITPDGPRGPRLRVQPGCVLAAMKSAAPIVPIAFECRRARRLRSWDRFVVPWPFTRVAVHFGEEIRVPAGLEESEIEAWCRRVEEALDAVTRAAAAELGIEPETAASASGPRLQATGTTPSQMPR